jgi:hypothetical protein
VFLLAFSLSMVSLCFLFASLFSKSKTAATLATTAFFASYFP